MNTFARDALVLPAKTLNVEISSQAVDHIIEYTEGYPYILQEYGKFLWDEASDSPISETIAQEVQPLVEAKLDNSFFRVRIDRTTELELKYLFAMAQLGSNPQKASDVAKKLGRSTEQFAGTDFPQTTDQEKRTPRPHDWREVLFINRIKFSC